MIAGYNVDAEQAIDIMLSMDCGDAAVEVALLPIPDKKPTWYSQLIWCNLTKSHHRTCLVVSKSIDLNNKKLMGLCSQPFVCIEKHLAVISCNCFGVYRGRLNQARESLSPLDTSYL